MLVSNQRGRGNEPVVVLGSIRLAVAVNMGIGSGGYPTTDAYRQVQLVEGLAGGQDLRAFGEEFVEQGTVQAGIEVGTASLVGP
jgi:hypothetical protein